MYMSLKADMTDVDMRHGYTAWKCRMYVHIARTYRMEKKHGQAAFKSSFDMQQGRATWTCCMGRQHEKGHAAWTMKHGHAAYLVRNPQFFVRPLIQRISGSEISDFRYCKSVNHIHFAIPLIFLQSANQRISDQRNLLSESPPLLTKRQELDCDRSTLYPDGHIQISAKNCTAKLYF